MRKGRIVAGVGLLAGVALVVTGWSGPAGAGILVQPDLHVRGADGNFVGNDVYNEDGSDQHVDYEVDFGETARIRVRVQNDGSVPAVFRLRGQQSAPGTKMRYFVGGQNVSKLMKSDDGLFTAPIGAGKRISVRVEATATDLDTDTDNFFVRGDSTVGDATFDVVVINVHANPLG